MKVSTRRKPVPAAPEPADLPTATALKLWLVLSRAFWSVSEIAKADIESSGLTPAEFAVLEALYHKGPLLLGDVQKKVLLSSGGITFLVDRLEKRGIVERLPCATDRRARYAALTKAGQKLMAGIFPRHAAAIRDAMAGIGRAEQREATELLKALGQEAARLAMETPACRTALAQPPD